MIKRILVGIGDTPFTEVAIERAVELAALHHAQLTAVTIVEPERICRVGPVPPGAGIFAKRLCENRLEVTRQQIEQADLVVMGNSIRSIRLRKVLGDTVLSTLTRSDRPLFLSQ